MKQTAVEWLIKQLHPTISIRLSNTYIKELIDKAISTEKKQIKDAYEQGLKDGYDCMPSINSLNKQK